jgi:hypothetical protein
MAISLGIYPTFSDKPHVVGSFVSPLWLNSRISVPLVDLFKDCVEIVGSNLAPKPGRLGQPLGYNLYPQELCMIEYRT